MNIKERLENNLVISLFLIFVAGGGFVVSALRITQNCCELKIHQNGTCITTDERIKHYVSTEKYKQQEAQLADWKEKYIKVLTENNILKSSEPMWAIQIDGAGYKTIDGKKDMFCGTIQPSDIPALNNTDVYEFDDYYYIFKYDKNENKNQLDEDMKSIRIKYPDLKCEIIDSRSYCPSRLFVVAEEFTNGENTFKCKTCK